VVFRHADGTTHEVSVHHSYNEAQIAWFKAGSALNLIKAQAGG
jgi:aconitate hydratase